MIEEAIEIRTADGIADGIIFRHDGGQRRPGVIHLTDIGGIRPSHRAMAFVSRRGGPDERARHFNFACDLFAYTPATFLA